MMNDLEGQHVSNNNSVLVEIFCRGIHKTFNLFYIIFQADISEEIDDVKAKADATKVLSKLALRDEDVEGSSESEEEDDDSEREIGYEEYKM